MNLETLSLLGGLAVVAVTLIGHIVKYASQKGAFEERERQLTARVALLEGRVEEHGRQQNDTGTALALLTQKIDGVVSAVGKMGEETQAALKELDHTVRQIVNGRIRPPRGGAE